LTESENFYGGESYLAASELPNVKCDLKLRRWRRSKEYSRYDCTRCSFAAARGISIALQGSQWSAVKGARMKQAQSKAHALVKTPGCEMATATNGAPHNTDGTIYIPKGVAEPSSHRESAAPPKVWNETVDCEARNALQVILSGSEILLDNACRISSFDQKAMLERILASAHHLNSIIASLTRPDELIGEIFVESVDPEEIHITGSKAF
jgi:hypothetical protein